MKVLLYCCKSWRWNNFLGLSLAGVFAKPLTCPPLDVGSFPYEDLAGVDLAYIALHGTPREPGILFGDDWTAALTAEALRRKAPEMEGAIVVLEGCYGERTEFPQAFLDLGARAVVSSKRPTFDKTRSLGRAGKFGRNLVKGLRRGASAKVALEEARRQADEETGEAFALAGDGSARVGRG